MLVCKDGLLDFRGLRGTVALTMADVRALYDGSPLARGRRIARLTEHQTLTLFPGAARIHMRNLRRIGRRLCCPRHLAPLAEGDTAGAEERRDCAQCHAELELSGLGFDALIRAARHTDPDAQRNEAARADIGGRRSTRGEVSHG